MNEPPDAGKIILKISGKDRLVMCNAIPKQANMLQIVPAGRDGVTNAEGCVMPGECCSEVMLPDLSLEPECQHLLPECQLQINNDHSCSLVARCTVPQVALCVVASTCLSVWSE